VFADKPGFVPWKVLLTHVLDALRRSICGPHANSSKAGFQPSLGPVSPGLRNTNRPGTREYSANAFETLPLSLFGLMI
jgi:hypothetical protein